MTVIRGGGDPLDQEVMSGIIHALLVYIKPAFPGSGPFDEQLTMT